MPLLKGVVKSVSFGERMRFARCMVNAVNCAMVSVGAVWMFGGLPAGAKKAQAGAARFLSSTRYFE